METRVAARRLLPILGLVPVLGLVLLIRLPFLNQAIQGDDHIYLTEAAHALVDPLHPQDAKYVFQGEEVDLRGHPHPPLNAWVLAGLIAAAGDVREVPFHAVYIVFSLAAAWAMWSLARRFSPRPVWAVLLFLAVPAFLVNGNSLETDVPFLAFWMAAIALFCAGRLWLAAAAMVLAAMMAYQAVLLTPILAVYVWLYCRRDRGAWLAVLVPPAAIAAWQAVQATAGRVLGYSAQYGFLGLDAKLHNALGLAIQFWFIIFPPLVPAALWLAWRKRREPATLFLLSWIVIFFAGALAIFFAGAARYLLPIATPLALLVSHLRPRWLAAGVAVQGALGLGMAVVSYQHWDGCRVFAESLRPAAVGHRVWVDGEWGLRYYLERDGALPLRRGQGLRAGDLVVSSALGASAAVNAPLAPVAAREIRPILPLRLIGLDSHSGYSTCARGFWPFGISAGPIDRLRAEMVADRHPTLEYLPMSAPEATAQIVSGVSGVEGNGYRWMSRRATFLLKNPAAPAPLRVVFAIPGQAPARKVTLRLDGREVAAASYPEPGSYVLATALPVRGAGESAAVEIEIDRTFSAPGDSRELGIVLTAVGFRPN
jgi:hypothetical protein